MNNENNADDDFPSLKTKIYLILPKIFIQLPKEITHFFIKVEALSNEFCKSENV